MTMKRVLLGVGVVLALALAACTNGGNPTAAEPRSFPSPDAESVRPNSIERVVAEVLPAVVNVVATSDGGEGEGSGFIVRDDGIIVTNYHVVEGASSVTVLTSEEEPDEYDARVVGGDIQADLAILDVDAEGLPTLPLGNSEGLRLGQQVVAIGYALGLEGGPSVTAGIVSSLAREITVADPNCPVSDCGTSQERVYTDTIRPTPPSTRATREGHWSTWPATWWGSTARAPIRPRTSASRSRSTRPSRRSSRPPTTPTHRSLSWGSARRTWAIRRCSSS
jgi:S1-C subfamily serine protease